MSRLRFLVVAAFAFSAVARAATFTVDTSSDASLTGCLPAVPADCSLRGAIERANANADADTIVFDIPQSDPGYIAATAHWRILRTDNSFPVISNPLTIDGYTQPGALENTLAPDEGGSNAVLKIELSGANAWSYGLHGYQMTVRGLAVNSFRSGNMYFYNALNSQFRIEGCFIGTDITGMSAPGDSSSNIGLNVNSGNVTVGGLTPAARNVISGHSYISINDRGSTLPNTYQGNIIGLAADGVTRLSGRHDFGIYMQDAPVGSLIGGDSVAARNIFSDHGFAAIVVTSGSSPNPPVAPAAIRILGNYFGTDWTGTLARGNGHNPTSPSQPYPTIQLSRYYRCGAVVGGTAPGEGNLIAHGGLTGVTIGSCYNAAILGNVFWNNRSLPIDLSYNVFSNGPTPNDVDDADGTEGVDPDWMNRGNRYQNHPELLALEKDEIADELHLTLRVDSAPAYSAYPLRLDFYASDAQQALLPVLVETIAEADAQQPLDVVLPLSAIGPRLGIVVTDAQGNSSEMTLVVVATGIFSDGFETL